MYLPGMGCRAEPGAEQSSRAGFGERFWTSNAGTQGCVGTHICLHHVVLGVGFWRVHAQDGWGTGLSLDTGVGLRVSPTSMIAPGERFCGCPFSLSTSG